MFDPWEDIQCQADFCMENADDFDYWLSEKGIDPRFVDQSDYELSYCEENSNAYEKFAKNYDEESLNWRENFFYNRPGDGK
jgi:hypothetical protein